MLRAERPISAPRTSRGARGPVTVAAVAALIGSVQLAAPVVASADTTPGAPVISVTADPPAGTHACPAPIGGAQSTLPLGTVCSFTISPNPADTSVPTEYEYTYPFNPGAPDVVSAADPGNGNTFDAATGVATITIVLNDAVGFLTANAVDAGNAAGPTTQLTVSAKDAAALGTPQTFADYDGDGSPDLVAAPLSSGDALANGLWFGKGGADGTVSANAENLSVNDNLGVSASGGPINFTGAQVLPGNWCGTGETSLLVYYPPTVAPTEDAGGGYVFCGDGDHDAVRNVANLDDGEVNLSSGSLEDTNGVNPAELFDGGNLAGTDSGIDDVVSVLDNELILSPAEAPGDWSTDGAFGNEFGTGGVCQYSSCAVLSDTPSPDGTLDWDSWKVVGYPLANGDIDMYVWNPTTGELVLWTGVTANDAANDGTWTNYTTLSYAQYVIDSGTGASAWNEGSNLALETADFNGDGTPDLWAVDTATATAIPYTATISGSTAALTSGATQSLITPAHEWELSDLSSGSASQAYDSGSDTAYMLRSSNSGASWTTDSTFGSVVQLDGSTGYLATNSSGFAVTAGSSFTIGAWVKPTGAGTVLAQEGTDDSSVFLSTAADGTWQFGINTAGTTAATYAQGDAGSWTAGAWTHVVLTYDASSGHLAFYVDGDRAATVNVSGATTVNGPFVLGANQTGGALGSYFPGEITRVTSFDTALTNQEVGQLP